MGGGRAGRHVVGGCRAVEGGGREQGHALAWEGDRRAITLSFSFDATHLDF